MNLQKIILVIFLTIVILFHEGDLKNFFTIPLILAFFGFHLCFKLPFTYRIIKKSIIYIKEARYITLFTIFALFGFIYNWVFNDASIMRFIIGGFFGYFVSFVLCYFLGIFITFYLSKKTLIKIYLSAIILIISVGIAEFISYKMGSKVIWNILYFISGRESEFTRIQSFFAEPGAYGSFLSFNIPLILALAKSKFQIYSNIYLDKIIKISLPFCLLLSLFLSGSPIALIFATIIFLFYVIFSQKISKKSLTIFLVLSAIFSIILLILYLNRYNYECLYQVVRIFNTISAFGSWNTFIIVEPSLATRIASFVNMFCVFLAHPVFGVSCGHLLTIFPKQLAHSPVPLTDELYNHVNATDVGLNQSVFFKITSETGIIGFLFMYAAFISLYRSAQKLRNYFQNSLCGDFFKGVQYTIVAHVFLTFYSIKLYDHYIWVLYGITSGILLREILRKNKINTNNVFSCSN